MVTATKKKNKAAPVLRRTLVEFTDLETLVEMMNDRVRAYHDSFSSMNEKRLQEQVRQDFQAQIGQRGGGHLV